MRSVGIACLGDKKAIGLSYARQHGNRQHALAGSSPRAEVGECQIVSNLLTLERLLFPDFVYFDNQGYYRLGAMAVCGSSSLYDFQGLRTDRNYTGGALQRSSVQVLRYKTPVIGPCERIALAEISRPMRLRENKRECSSWYGCSSSGSRST